MIKWTHVARDILKWFCSDLCLRIQLTRSQHYLNPRRPISPTSHDVICFYIRPYIFLPYRMVSRVFSKPFESNWGRNNVLSTTLKVCHTCIRVSWSRYKAWLKWLKGHTIELNFIKRWVLTECTCIHSKKVSFNSLRQLLIEIDT